MGTGISFRIFSDRLAGKHKHTQEHINMFLKDTHTLAHNKQQWRVWKHLGVSPLKPAEVDTDYGKLSQIWLLSNRPTLSVSQLTSCKLWTLPQHFSLANTSTKFSSPNKTSNTYPRPKRNPSPVAFSQSETAEKRGKHVIHLQANGETRKMWENKCVHCTGKVTWARFGLFSSQVFNSYLVKKDNKQDRKTQMLGLNRIFAIVRSE